MTQDEFIDKWLVGYESREQKEEFVIEMMADLASLQPKGKTKEEVFKEKASKIMKQFEINGFKRTYPTLLQAIYESMEEYAQSHANKDGCKVVPWQCCPACNGSGQMYEPLSTGTYKTCPTCNGERIIPMHVTPPQP